MPEVKNKVVASAFDVLLNANLWQWRFGLGGLSPLSPLRTER
jgi:hypothetical protein